MPILLSLKPMKLRIFSVILITILLASFTSAQNSKLESSSDNDKLLMAVAWYQHSAEMEALYYQGFNIARFRLDEALAAGKPSKPPGVVVDIDETMLDNSPFETMVINNTDFQKGWYEWTSKASAKALPGALEFVRYAQSKNVDVFYITNRDDNERIGTLKNLVNAGFPFATDDHLLTRNDTSYSNGNTSSKMGRRAKVAENHTIVLLIGDNLNDFSEIFENRSLDDGKMAVEENRELFGLKFIVLPNPMYGAWEKPLYDYRNGLSDEEKTKMLKEKLILE
jgi:5'-nucleotidase (lipoprotein e(P4) family)